MQRDKNLIPLSHQHQHALALCVRIDRAQPISAVQLPAWQEEVSQTFEHEIKIHFSAEEAVLFPPARQFAELNSLIDDLLSEHVSLRKCFSEAEAHRMSSEGLVAFARELSAHIRKEERQLFERLQKLMNPDQLVLLGSQLDEALKDAAQVCSLRTTASHEPIADTHNKPRKGKP
jgi:iron-sulfur cluster repair protein YtfE (RIC family)